MSITRDLQALQGPRVILTGGNKALSEGGGKLLSLVETNAHTIVLFMPTLIQQICF